MEDKKRIVNPEIVNKNRVSFAPIFTVEPEMCEAIRFSRKTSSPMVEINVPNYKAPGGYGRVMQNPLEVDLTPLVIRKDLPDGTVELTLNGAHKGTFEGDFVPHVTE